MFEPSVCRAGKGARVADQLIIRGAREHNLKDVSLDLPRDSLIVFTGLSGSGKSSLAFDTIFAEGQRRYVESLRAHAPPLLGPMATPDARLPAPPGRGRPGRGFAPIFAEGQRRYVESLSAYARQFLGQMDKPDVDFIEGLSPAVSIDQKSTSRNPRSTVGTITEVYDYLRLLYARAGTPHGPTRGRTADRPHPAVHRRHDHRGLRLPPAALRPGRHAALPEVRADHRAPAAVADRRPR